MKASDGRSASATPRTSRPAIYFGNEDTKSRALDKVELLCSKAQPPSIEKVWLALQEVVGGAENLSAHRRDRVELAMVRNRGESPTHLATLIVDAAGL